MFHQRAGGCATLNTFAKLLLHYNSLFKMCGDTNKTADPECFHSVSLCLVKRHSPVPHQVTPHAGQFITNHQQQLASLHYTLTGGNITGLVKTHAVLGVIWFPD